MRETHPSILRFLAAATALLVAGFLLWQLQEILNPFLLYLLLVSLLLPFRKTEGFLPVVVAVGAITVFWLLSEMGFLLAPFIVAVVGAYILNPVVSWIAESTPVARLDGDDGEGRMARSAAVTALGLPVLGGLLVALIWGGPWLIGEAEELARTAPEVLDRAGAYLEALEGRLESVRLPGFDGSAWAAQLRELDGDSVVAFLQERQEAIQEWLWTGAIGVGRGIGTAFSVLGYLVLTPVVAFYLMRDWDRVVAGTRSLVPPRYEWVTGVAREYDRLLASYLRGQVTVSVIVGTLTAVGLWIVSFPYALFLGLVVAVFNVVPYLGLVLSLIPALGIALASGSVGLSLLKVAIVYGVAQGLESAVISPRIVGDSTGLHPVWILLAIATGGFFFGFVGLLIAVPTAVGVKLAVSRGMRRYRGSSLFEEAAVGDTAS